MLSKLMALSGIHMRKFIIVGMSNTATSYLIFIVLQLLFNNYILSATLSYLLILIKSFFLNKTWVFKSNRPISLKLTLYFLFINLFSLASNLVILVLLTDSLNFNVYLSQVIALLVTMGINFNGYNILFTATKQRIKK